MNKWRLKIDALTEIYHLVGDLAQLAEMKRLREDQAMQRKGPRDEVDARRDELSRDVQYVALLQQGIDLLRQSLKRSVERLESFEVP